MSNLVNLLTKEQLQTIQDVCDIMDSALSDNRKVYPARKIDQHGSHPYIANREEYLEDIIGHALTALSTVFPQVE